ncbi:MAG TPA: periplasmic heavy metal sensor [Candidatus Baltobacteraceae bacterium]|nr:periplasmic heavy metal sensor [Candidatus Baltobacteraceae bacterium]
MRFKLIVTLIFAASLSIIAGSGAAQAQEQNPPAPPASAESGQQSGTVVGPGDRARGAATIGGAMITPEMMQAMGPEVRRARTFTLRDDRDAGGPLQRFSRLMNALDDPRERKMLGLSDQQADSLHKIVIDTETFTITTGANMAVDAIQLRELLRADKPDKAAVKSKGDEISRDTSELINHYLDAILDAKTILTPQQQEMIRAYLENGAPALPPQPVHP